MPDPVIRVLVADDHGLFREGVASVLSRAEDVAVVGEAGTGEACLDLLETTACDVVLMDLKMPGCGGIEATRVIAERHPGVRVVALTMFDDDHSVLAALRAGASGYVVKDADRGAILRAVRAAAHGEVLLAGAAARHAIERPSSPRPAAADPPPELAVLTSREREVLELVAAGLRNRDIGRRLFITEKTVGNHLSAIFAKLHVSSRVEAVALLHWARTGDRGLSTSDARTDAD